jgi:glycosyltransferase involved in cell wall biosynthesis
VPIRQRGGGPPASDDGFIGCCARLVPWKGVDLLLRAFARARENAPAIKLRVYGERVDAEYFAKLEKIVADLKLGDAVEFHSYTPDIQAVFAKGRFFVVPSLSMRPGPETFSRIIIEAWAHAKPVIAFENGGPRYLIDDGENGYLVAEGDVEALSDRIHKLLADPALCERLGASGHRKVRESFNPPLIAGALLEKLVGPVPN